MEWFAMVYLIQTQRGRKVEQILFDHNHENLHEFSSGQMNYRKRERRMRTIYRIAIVVYISVYAVVLFPFFFILWKPWAVQVLQIFNITEALAMCLIFFRLFYLMWKLHGYEFNKHKKQLVLYFAFTLAEQCMKIFVFYALT
jgi:hypothetical protein